MSRVLRFLACTLLVVAPTGAALAQTTATVRGRVLDGQGRPVAAATVTVTGTETGLAREVPVDAEGSPARRHRPRSGP